MLATVVTGVYLGTRTEGMLQAASRVSGTMFWRTLIFLLESALFVLLGLELRSVVDHLSGAYSVAWLAGAAAAVVAVVDRDQAGLGADGVAADQVHPRPALRLRAQPVAAALRHRLGRHARRDLPGHRADPAARSVTGTPFTERSTLIFLAAVVVVATLVGEGLTLGPLLGALGLAEGDEQRRREAKARQRVTEAGLARLDELVEAGEVDEDTANVYRQLFELRLERVRAALDETTATARAHRRCHRRHHPHIRHLRTSWFTRSATS